MVLDWKKCHRGRFNLLPPNPRPYSRMIGHLLILAADGLSVAIPVLAISLSFILLLGVVISALMLIDLIVRAYAVRLIYMRRMSWKIRSSIDSGRCFGWCRISRGLGALRKAIVGW